MALNAGDPRGRHLPDGSQQVIKDDNARTPGSNVQTETFDDELDPHHARADGSVVTIRDADMDAALRNWSAPMAARCN